MHRKILTALAAGTASVALLAAPALATVGSAYPVHNSAGPGLKNWHCVDPHSSWTGPWRFTKAGAFIDCDSFNSRADRP